MRLPWVEKRIQREAAIRREAIADTIKRLNDSNMLGVSNQKTEKQPIYAYDYPFRQSINQAPTKSPLGVVSVDTLRKLADNYDVLRSCIQQIKREVASVPIDIVVRGGKKQSGRADARIATAKKFLERKGGIGGIGCTRAEFEGKVLEDLQVVGAGAVWFHPTYGGGIYQCIAIDAATIRPVADEYGFPADPPFQQWVQGMQTGSYSYDEMSYSGLSINATSRTLYYRSPVEWLINVVNSALRADQWNREWLVSGTTANDVFALPEEWSVAQIREFSDYWELMLAGDSKARQKTKFVPSGSSKLGNNTRKDQDFAEYELWLLRRTCAIMGVAPASIGFAGEQYKVSQDASMDSTSDFGVGSVLLWRKDMYDDILERMGFGDLECINVNATEEKASDRATRHSIDIASGVSTINEARAENGDDPVEGGDVTLVPATLRPLEQALAPPEPVVPPGGKPDPKKDIKQRYAENARIRRLQLEP